MNNNYDRLLNEFKSISSKKWIKGVNNYTNSAGLTLESLLNKKSDSMYFPDYNGIEIKCTQRFSGYPISLFSLAFDGPRLYEIKEILNKYGKNDAIYKDKKILISTLSTQHETKVNGEYYFKLEVNEEEKKMYLVVYDNKHNLLEKEAYIDFKTIKDRLELKLSYLAIVWASKRKIESELYFRYYKITIYKLISFEKFMQLLKQDVIKIDIICRVSRSGIEAGRQRNKNLVFKIAKEKVELLFDIIKTYNADEDGLFQII